MRGIRTPPLSTPLASLGPLDSVGIGLVAVTISWTILVADLRGGSAETLVASLLLAACAYGLARAMSSVSPAFVSGTLLLVAVLMFVASPARAVSSRPLFGPLGYTNADGAFWVQAALAGAMVGLTARRLWMRLIGAVCVLFFGAIPIVIHSVAPAILGIVLIPTALLVRERHVRAFIALSALAVIMTVAITAFLGITFRAQSPPSIQREFSRYLSFTRLQLWHDAVRLLEKHPVVGVGIDRFKFTSPTALSDPDHRWAHNEFLQRGAEGGLPGLLLAVSLFVWAFARLLATPQPGRLTALGAAALAALGIQACIDYVMNFPQVPAAAAALVGVASTGRLRLSRPFHLRRSGRLLTRATRR